MRAASNTQKPGAAGKMKQLIIAEKPSLARSVMTAIGSRSFSKKGGYYEDERYVISYQTEETIREELSHMKPDQEYDNLYDEGLCRTIMDWMYRINLSRYLTIRAPGKTVYAVGRVLTPIVKAVADRDEAIESFVPEKYYQAVSETEIRGKALKLSSPKRFPVSQKAEAEDLCGKLNANRAVVSWREYFVTAGSGFPATPS